ncbi:hypothetical protein FOA52_013951 [Chlamydomonas sp. UWO 241]|nr:hypothetical protein FOA52_013951 [Chlamydomonas sp. UWO 241]
MQGAMSPAFTATKLAWTKANEPHVFERAASLLLPGSYVNWWLTGEMGMDAGDASGTALLDTRTRKWDEAAAALVDAKVAAMLPRLLAPSEPVGLLRHDRTAELGLPKECGPVTVSAGSGDNACAALGAGMTHDGQEDPARPRRDAVGGVSPERL